VKQFAEFEEAEQNELTEVLRSLSDPGATASTAAAASTAPVLSGEAAQVMERFSRAQPGPGFDRDYVAAQIVTHRDLLGVQGRFLRSNPSNRELANIARLARGRVQEHLTRLETLQQDLGR
jgi:putative membrane protein